MVKSSRIDIIEVLRLAAALGVMLFHCGISHSSKGTCAVEMFFIISGYLAMVSSQKRGPESPVRMFLRKLLRIVPLYWAATLFMYLMIAVRPDLSILSEARPVYLIKSLFFIPFMNSSGSTVPILGCGWTLNYEVLFILIFCIASRVCYTRRGVITIAVLASLSLIGLIVPLPFVPCYYTDTVILEFALGILLYYFLDRDIRIPGAPAVAAAAVCLFAAVMSEAYMDELPRSIITGIPMAVFLFLIINEFGHASVPVWLVTVGSCSFEIYIAEYFSSAAYKVLTPGMTLPLKIIILTVIIAVTVAAAYFVHRILSAITGPLTERLKQ